MVLTDDQGDEGDKAAAFADLAFSLHLKACPLAQIVIGVAQKDNFTVIYNR